ncbi:hypothetical protein ACWGJW_33195 [Streptomyces nigrescens]
MRRLLGEGVRCDNYAYSLLNTSARDDPVRSRQIQGVLLALIANARVAYEAPDRIQFVETPAGPDTAALPVQNQLPSKGCASSCCTRLVFDAEGRDWPTPVIVHRVRVRTRHVSAAGRAVGTATCVPAMIGR